MKKTSLIIAITAICSLAPYAFSAQTKAAGASPITTIESSDQFKALLDSSGSKLLMFDLYADWCMPCKILSPILEKIASDMKSQVSVYKINIDKQPELSSVFRVSGIPFVALIKEKTVVKAFIGVQPEAAYRRAIAEFSSSTSEDKKDQADGNLVNGVRTIKLTTSTSIGNLYVYRGEEVQIIFDKVDFPFSVHIPKLKVSGEAKTGENLSIKFKAANTGVFSMMCIGKCPVGDGQQFARIVVLEYSGDNQKALFKNVSSKAASELITSEKPFILDVRTPGEFFSERIPGATLIPLQQLAERITEIDSLKDKSILVYCRSGNRSIPAAQILIQNGFKKVYNMQSGITGWVKGKLPVEK